jgi:hypothetical protein
MHKNIDIVIPWVDGSDAKWRDLYKTFKPKKENEHSDDTRFRDWELMRYWFRGIEKNMPWIRKVHFITCGHVPPWLDIKHEKINIVKHEDYIPSQYLPVFSSHVIEIFIHKIKDLSDKFIYFNDDFFVLNELSYSHFFDNELPRDTFSFNTLGYENIAHIIMNDIKEINMCFTKKNVLRKNFFKIFNWHYIDKSLRSVLLLPWPRITGFYDHHLPQAYLKKTFEDVWSLKQDVLVETAKNRFRSNEDINQYLFRYWQLCKGDFSPFNLYKYSEFVSISDDNVCDIKEKIKRKNKKIIVLNDGVVSDFCKVQKNIQNAFDYIYPEMCSYEKY